MEESQIRGIRPRTNVPLTATAYLSTLRQDIAIMLEYCRVRGVELDTAVADSVTKLFAADTSATDAAASNVSQLQLAHEVHAAVSHLIAPVTADSIQASRIRQNYALLFIGCGGLVGFTGLILSILWHKLGPASAFNNPAIDVIFAALLGSAFYSFWTAKDYLRDSTFGRQYTQVYLIRFFLGIVSGFIIGNSTLFGVIPADADSYSPQLLGLVGGFSADAVAQILQRIADVLVTTIKGSDKDAAQTAADKAVTQKISSVAAQLQEIIANGKDQDSLTKGVQDVIKKLTTG